jgi:hypothetical protein
LVVFSRLNTLADQINTIQLTISTIHAGEHWQFKRIFLEISMTAQFSESVQLVVRSALDIAFTVMNYNLARLNANVRM